jgi:hypothetical protein
MTPTLCAGRFSWHGFDVRSVLPEGWQESILATARRCAKDIWITPTPQTSREESAQQQLLVHTIPGRVLRSERPWLYRYYLGTLRELAQSLHAEPVSAAEDVNFGLNLNVQLGSAERYECHVDTAPVAGLLYVTDHPVGEGGELVVSNRGSVLGKAEVDADATRIHPVAGHLIVMSAIDHTHYVSRLTAPDAVRAVVVMSFYTPSRPEHLRPDDLVRHLGLD